MKIIANHGTYSGFDRFDMSRLGANTDINATDESYAQTAHLGVWFNSGGDLSIYPVMMVCEITLNKPMVGGNLEYLAYWISSQAKSGKELREQFINQGYDGIIIDDEEFGGTSYVIFNPDNIKIIKTRITIIC